MAILSLGSILADFQLRIDAVDDFGSAMRPGRDLVRLSGGKAANVAAMVRRLGREARLLGRVGTDDLAEQALAGLGAAGVNLDGVRRAAGDRTGIAVIGVAPDGSKRSVAAGEANFGFDADDVEQLAATVFSAPAESVLVVDYEMTPRAVSRAIAVARDRGFTIVVDPSYPHLVERADLRSATVLTPNEAEARALAAARKDVPLAAVAHSLAALGPRSICIKLEGGGCLYLHEGRLWRQHAAPVAAVDTSGAGDAFAATIAVAFAEGKDMREAVLLAVVAAELVVNSYGGQTSYPDSEKIRARLHEGDDRPLLPCDE